MEFGPRSLGNRAILADPRKEEMQKKLNLKIKFRESFRPFAPSITYESVNKWFNLNIESPYMLLVSEINNDNKIKENIEELKDKNFLENLYLKRSNIPAVTHVDYSARIQTVHKETNQKFYNLLKEFERTSNCPILVNTSFNVRGEPIVCSVEDAFNCFMATDLDILVCNNFILYKNEQNNKNLHDYKNKFELD
jgi:carbamoyltransferase